MHMHDLRRRSLRRARTCSAFDLNRWLIVLMSSCDIVSWRMPTPAEAQVCAAVSVTRSRNGSSVSRGTLRKRVGAASPAVYVRMSVAIDCAWRRVGANMIAGFALAYSSTVLYVGRDIACMSRACVPPSPHNPVCWIASCGPALAHVARAPQHAGNIAAAQHESDDERRSHTTAAAADTNTCMHTLAVHGHGKYWIACRAKCSEEQRALLQSSWMCSQQKNTTVVQY